MTELDPRVAEYRQNYGQGPFLTGDSVVIRHRGPLVENGVTREPEILLVQRKKWPGEGMWALPGGFMNPDDDSVLGCAVRELGEESKLRIEPHPSGNFTLGQLLKSFQRGNPAIGDRPDRDPRARIVSHCFLFDLRPVTNNPKLSVIVEAADDAAAVTWMTLAEIEQITLFADHTDLIHRCLRFATITI